MKQTGSVGVSFSKKVGLVPIIALGLGGTAWAAEPASAQSTAELRRALPDAQIQLQGGRIARILGNAMATGATAGEAADAFRAKAAKGLSAVPGELVRAEIDSNKLASAKAGDGMGLMYQPATGTYKFLLLRHQQVRGKVPVYGAELRTMVKNEVGYPVVWASSTVRDLKDFDPASAPTDSAVDVAKARTAVAAYAKDKGAASTIPTTFSRISKSDRVIFAGAGNSQEPPRMAVQYTVEDGDPAVPVAQFVADAKTGEILHAVPLQEPVNVGGTVRAMSTDGTRAYDPADADCSPIVSTPMAHAEVSITGDPVGYSSTTGYYYLIHSGSSAVTVNSPIQGQWFQVTDMAGAVESLNLSVVPPGAANFLHNAANTSEFVRAQAMAYVHANRVRDFLLSYLPSYPGVSTTTSFPITVNYATTLPGGFACPNASGGTGGINFCRQVPAGKNSAYGGVIYHEYGHAIVRYTSPTAVSEYSEGMADSIANAMDEMPGVAYGWKNTNCQTALRMAQNDCQYAAAPNCTANCGSSGHSCGRLLLGSIYDVRQQLMVTHPTDYRDILNPIMFSSIPLNGAGLIDSTILDDFLTLDDDNGNLADGTPHRAEICAGFGAHGITDANCPAIPPKTACSDVCGSPTTFSWSGSYWSGELGTGSVCRETTQTIAGGNCGNLAAGRKLYVNGQQMTCNNQNWSAIPAKVNNGYCITTTPGDYRWAYFQLW